MLEIEYREWLEARGAQALSARNTRVYAIKTIEKNLAALGSPYNDLNEAYKADGFAQLRERIKQIRNNAKNGGYEYRILMPESKNPLNRLVSWNSWLGQYGRFLSGDISQTDRIWDYVRHHYIAPARERGEKSVVMATDALNSEMNMSMSWTDICETLANSEFQELANVPAPLMDEAAKKITFILMEGEETVSQEPSNPTNLILYGPPGTGKTYNTAREAVALCDGTADYPLTPEGREELMDRYNELMAEKRISFVTFHQSYDYETFVEGLRPETDGDETLSTGFRLVPVPGIFREICALADQARTRKRPLQHTSEFDLKGRHFWKMAQGTIGSEDDVYEDAQANGYIALGWGGAIDWSAEKFSSFDAIKDEWLKQNPGNQTPSNWTQTYPFRSEMKVGDIVIVPYGNTAFRAIAEVTGDYYFVPSAEGYYAHRRRVRWLLTLNDPLPLDTIVEGKFTMRTLYSLPARRVNIAGLSRLINVNEEPEYKSIEPVKPEQFVLIIDEINRANISKVFGELITLLEPDKRLGMTNALTVTLPYSKKKDFGIPANLHIIGTMNTADRSIALLDTALRRRFNFREMAPEADLLGVVENINLRAVLTTINRRIEYLVDREHRIGHAFFMHCKTKFQIEEVMRNKVIPLLQEYFFDDWSRISTVLGDGFIQNESITPPPGIDGEKMLSWSVRPTFKENAFKQLEGHAQPISDQDSLMANGKE
ncbi:MULTISPECIES: AAA family ATPase [Enterobacteriaceae]|uniref:AAA family ATPase n=1 Tax=Kluyvera genomosp. 2 TaxID=2774054 RepID=A0A2T2Y7K7_9ENTR|nr:MULTISPECIES: AAA family ATPase [Enterobacteriaceae]HAT3916765.1 AAA domain-containing protein [Kluyvera ascorbata]PSR48522.1 AAA family ATPase [Kluyvera genomosp. 2]BBQ82805.1 hypothetical protein WP3W18E02_13340 [Klebsiella sp. WP3-W18-ESBL-02]BBR19840.1 hypothetical protein WP3S18E05_13200 [Klebsiella sp. WP3-S18-ESBL-05]BBR59934.1 hypothetical protein WP4W18E05_33020 [Klebsiella sp. WP4-W18-ESBL-05]